MPKLENAKITLCDNCYKVCGLKRCSLCKITYYCDLECQNAHWASHKTDCKTLNHQSLDKDVLKRSLIEFMGTFTNRVTENPAISFVLRDGKEAVPVLSSLTSVLAKSKDKDRIIRFVNVAVGRERFDKITVVKLSDEQQKNLNDLKVDIQLEYVNKMTQPDDIIALAVKVAGLPAVKVDLSAELIKLDPEFMFFQYKTNILDEMDLIRL